MIKQLIIVMIYVFFSPYVGAQLNANAGGNKHFCTSIDSSNILMIGGNPTVSGGVAPYIFEWSIDPIELYPGSDILLTASDILDDTIDSNPKIVDFTVSDSIRFYLKVTDDIGTISYDTCLITISSFGKSLMYHEYYIDLGDSIFLEEGTNIFALFNNNNLAYQWTPSQNLSDANLSNNFWAFPEVSTWYSVTITDSYGCQATGDPYYHITVTNLGIDQQDHLKLHIYPNPVEEQFQFIAEQNVSFVQITDLQGSKVSYTQNGNTFNLINCKTGVYILFFELNGAVYHQRLIKN